MKYIIDFYSVATDNEITAYLVENSCTVIKVYNNFLKVYLVNSETTPPVTSIVESVVNDDNTTIVPLGEFVPVNQYYNIANPNYPSINISTTDEKDWWKNYVLSEPDFDNQTVTLSRKGNGVSVYIMDSGIHAIHPEFLDSTIVNLFSITDNFLDTSGHGTAIASVISGKSCGLTSATLKIVKIFDKNQPTRQSDMLNALDSVLGDFSINNQQAAVLNCSWHIDKNQYIENKIRTLINQGIFVVAAAGNSGVPIENVTPASMPEVITMGSYGPNFEPSDFSNYSEPSVISNTANEVNSGRLDGWAPGEKIWVALLNEGYGYSAGTSISTGIHSGVLAYNLADRLFSDHTLPDFTQNASVSLLSGISLRRKGLMDLSDPKYAGSANCVSTLVNRTVLDANELDHYEMSVKIGVLKGLTQIYNPTTTKTVEIIEPLPDGFYFIPSGNINGIANSVVGNYQIFNSLIRITNINDETRDVTVVIAILSDDFDKTQISADDPILQINLDDFNCSTDAFCPGISTGIACFDDCENYFPGQTCKSFGCKTPAGRKSCYCA
jgi:subtilisin family serine protease